MPNWLSIVLALGGSTLCGLIVTGIWNFLNKKALKSRELQEKDKTDELIKTIKENRELYKGKYNFMYFEFTDIYKD